MPPVIVQANDYDPWGMDISSFEEHKQNNFKFLGRESIAETGWVDLMKRMYDPPTGRFISVDPSPDVAGQESLSTYQYGYNNPLRYPDPNGDCPKCKEYAEAFWGGVKDGAKSTVNFVKSLGTSQGRENAVVGTMRFFEMFAPYVDPPAETQANRRQFYGGIENYVRSVPDKTGTQLAHDAGYGLEKVAETVAVSKGANLVKGAIAGKALGFADLAETGTINPNSVRFSQGSIAGSFKNGGDIAELVTGLKNGTISPSSIPAIRIVEKDGMIFTLDNRRLHAFQQAGVPIPYQKLEIIPQNEMFKFKDYTSGKTDGTSVRVRGQ